MQHQGLNAPPTTRLDEDAFAALSGQGAGIRVGPEVACSLADYHLRDPDDVGELLRWLQQAPRAEP